MIHDPMDNITNKNTEHGVYQYGYDDLHRLTSVDNLTVPSLDDESFTYDPVGNRLTSADTTGNWSYSQNNELQSYDTAFFVYDDNGNMTQKTDGGVVTNYIYNQEDRMIRVEDSSSGVVAEYYYDPFGRRLWKDVVGVKTHFYYADEGLIGEYDSSGSEIKTYGYVPGSMWTTDPLFMKEGGSYYFYQNDKLGTPQKMTAVNGAVSWSAKYFSFGEVTIDVSVTIVNNLRFPGQYYDQETGIHYNFYRYYYPSSGRYLRKDPIGLEGGIDFYCYVLNNPMKLVDPKGLSSITAPVGPIGPLFIHPESPYYPGSDANKDFANDMANALEDLLGEPTLFNPDDYDWPGKGERGGPWAPEDLKPYVDPMPWNPNDYECKPPKDPCVYICTIALEGKWYVKGWAWPLCILCIISGGNSPTPG